MVSSRWQRWNTTILRLGLVAWVIYAVLIDSLFRSAWLERNGLSLLVTLLGTAMMVGLTYFFMQRYARSMIRVLKWDLEATDFALRMMLKVKHIRYIRDSEDDLYRYQFPGHSLTMTVQPYFSHHWVASGKAGPQVATKVTLGVLTEKSQEFAGILADAIDEMARQPVKP